MTDDLTALHALAKAMGVQTSYTDGLGKPVMVSPETLIRVCAAMGVTIGHPAEAADALHAWKDRGSGLLPPVIIAWDGHLPVVAVRTHHHVIAQLHLEGRDTVLLAVHDGELGRPGPIPFGYHRLTIETADREESATVISAPLQAWRRPGEHRSWGIGTQLAALRSSRSRSVGDLRDLRTLCQWIRDLGGDLVTVLPLLPTFNTDPPEPSPYSPVSRLFWSELTLDLGDDHRPAARAEVLDVTRADREVRAAFAGRSLPDEVVIDDELRQYARFRGAQARLGRNWRDWPEPARSGSPTADHVDAAEERFQQLAQTEAHRQLLALRQHLDHNGFRLGLDLAVGVHPDGYDSWSRQELFAKGISVGAPPDLGFPSGQDWGFSPVLPEQSRREGHQYLAASIGHQMAVAGVLRVDHIMAWTRLYWIPEGLPLSQGTYVHYPAEELFAVLTLESERHQCEVLGENLGTVPVDIVEALPRHRIWGMYVTEFAAATEEDTIAPPTADDVAMIGTHDTPTLAGWIAGDDIAMRLQHGLLLPAAEGEARASRAAATTRLSEMMGVEANDPHALLTALLDWLGASASPLVVPWIEDLWLEERGVNLPGTRSSNCPNWQRPMRQLLDEIMTDPQVALLLRRLHAARTASPTSPHA